MEADKTSRRTPKFPSVGAIVSVRVVRESRAGVAPEIGCAADIYAGMAPYMRSLPHEEFWVLCCDVKNKVVASAMVGRGTLDATLVHPREVFKVAILSGAASVVLVHNHPSGDPEPSAEDAALTRRLAEAGTLLGIPVLDHIVCGARGYVSFSERGLL